MTKFARISNNVVVDLIVASPDHINSLPNKNEWKQVKQSKENLIGVGSTYDATLQEFIPKKTYASWVLNKALCDWEAPVKRPIGKDTVWNEDTRSWDIL